MGFNNACLLVKGQSAPFFKEGPGNREPNGSAAYASAVEVL